VKQILFMSVKYLSKSSDVCALDVFSLFVCKVLSERNWEGKGRSILQCKREQFSVAVKTNNYMLYEYMLNICYADKFTLYYVI
jgi:hypothetical protein